MGLVRILSCPSPTSAATFDCRGAGGEATSEAGSLSNYWLTWDLFRPSGPLKRRLIVATPPSEKSLKKRHVLTESEGLGWL